MTTPAPAPATSVDASQTQHQTQSVHTSGGGNVSVDQSQHQDQSVHVSDGGPVVHNDTAAPTAGCHPDPPVECTPAVPPPADSCHPAPPTVDCPVPVPPPTPEVCGPPAPPTETCTTACAPPAPVECDPVIPVDVHPVVPVNVHPNVQVDCQPIVQVDCQPIVHVEYHPILQHVECHDPIVVVDCHSSAIHDGSYIVHHSSSLVPSHCHDGTWFGGAHHFSHGSATAHGSHGHYYQPTDVSFIQQSLHHGGATASTSSCDPTADLYLTQISAHHPVAFSGADCGVTDLLAQQYGWQGQSQSFDVSSGGCYFGGDLSVYQTQAQSQHFDAHSAAYVHPVTFC
ncbi:hypothetical protein AMAG_20030 [Allomyces macrogynus ATCC 38327]|uniref:Uncharacterized protein n=1 Tax=Allomyces macrogynus (strain ATCC 38327) TaxID=578462 RepID=A0A0L0T598_ALLM3|nr:hypothetical protein AMAG_20030 [Allomyces macrogynus ATCC 38327]|eukprot:KNE69729.1 hypothetical protein AMAG_20030 [Allomyces macrogynus ATCC 38327]